MSNQGASGSSGNFPLDNLTYDLITILYEKSKGLEAYDKYQRDAQGNQQVSQLLQQMRQQDEQHIRQLQQFLAQQLGGQGGMSQQVGG
jgi:ferritin-like metal-binding protein YciE